MSALYSKELKSYFTNMNGYIPISLILVMAGIFVKTLCFDYGNPNMEIALPYVNLILLIAIPILAMRSFSEEKHQKTEQLLYSLPLTSGQIVAAKYFAMMTVLLVPIGLLALVPFVLSLYGSVNFLMSFSALLGFYLLCGAMVAICMFMSSLTESQIISAVLSAGVLILLYASDIISNSIPSEPIASFVSLTVLIAAFAVIIYVFTKNYWIPLSVAAVFEIVNVSVYFNDQTKYTGLIQKIIEKISIFNNLENFVYNEIFDLSSVIYYISIAFFFSFLTAQVFEKKRWN